MSGRRPVVLALLGALFILGFYTLTDPALISAESVAHDHVLQSADYAGYAVCHRITERSFTVAGRQFPLCARCTGMYLGVFVIFAVLGLAGRWRRAALPPLSVLIVLGALVALMGVDGLNSYSHFFPDFPHLYQPQNWLRLLTGLGTGLGMGLIMFPALAQTLWRAPAWEPPVASLRELAGILALTLLVFVLVLSNQNAILYVLAIASAFGLIAIMTALNSTTVLLLTRREGRARGWLHATAPLLIGLALAAAEIAVVAIGRFHLTGTLTGFPGL
ncbi:MAG: DUF2085 domain-containing protein [Candidatus Promineifilaceae bacterium]|nr:DUF2085 domain-containing protein [Candidatus Promineifilaceae bacterium]